MNAGEVRTPDVVARREKNDRAKKSKGVLKGMFAALLMVVLVGGAAWQMWKVWEAGQVAPVPVPYMMKAVEYVGTELSEDGASFTAKFDIEVFKEEGWKKIRLLPSNVAIRKSKLPAGAYLHLDNGIYTMLTEKHGEMQVEISFSVAAVETEGKLQVMFPRVPSVTCVLDATFPESGLDVKVLGAQSIEYTEKNGTARVVAALPDNTPISIVWEEALPEIEKGPSKYYSETRTLISIGEGLIIGQGRINFTILHTATRELAMMVPNGVSVLQIAGRHIRDWRVTGEKLSVQLEKEVIGPYTLDIKYESSPDMASGKVVVPVITGSGVVREKGDIGVVALTNVEVKNETVSKAHLIDVKDLPSEMLGMTTQPVLLAYRYVEPDFKVELDISKHDDVGVLLTIIDKAHFSVMQTFDGKRIIRAIYNVRNNRNQFVRLEMPEDADLWSASVAGKSVQPAKDEDGRVLLPLVRSQGKSGMSSFPVEIIYAEEGTPPDSRGTGIAKVELPDCSEPIMHLMVSLYVPDEGRYDDFTGTLRRLDKFSHVFKKKAVPVPDINAAAQAVQQAYNMKTGGIPGNGTLGVQLPMSGKVFLLEKILVVKDSQWFSYEFKRLRT